MPFINRYFKQPAQSFFLFGPRGTGKSTLIRELYNDALWVDLLNPETLRNYSAYPERLFELVQGNPEKKIIVIDEVQKIPLLLNVVHSLIEEDKSRQFILTGSSSRKLRVVGADLLAGRAIRRNLHPFMAGELDQDFSLEKALLNGMIPLVIYSSEPQEVLQTYIGHYLKEEIQAEGLVRNLESFSRFLEKISFSHGSLLNVMNISRECEVKRKTVENYIEILEDLLLAFKLDIFTLRAQRALISHPKFYLFDTGVYRSLRPKGTLDIPQEIEGVALEGLVAQHLRAWSDYTTEKHTVSFWRTRSGLEVDFIVYGPLGLWGIEVKNATKIYPADLRSLESFLEDYPEGQALYLYRGKDRLYQKGILCLPVNEFLTKLRPNEAIWNFQF